MTTSQKLDALDAIRQQLSDITFTEDDAPIERNIVEQLCSLASAVTVKVCGLRLVLHPENGRRETA